MSEEKNSVSQQPKLTIVICTIEEREEQFLKLYNKVHAQCIGKPVELITYSDNKQISIGKKRQQSLIDAKGKKICWIDDDDDIADYYVDELLKAPDDVDAIGFLIDCFKNGKHDGLAKASMKYPWANNVDGFKYVRSNYHKTPINREIALQVGFPNLRFAEDFPYSEGCRKLIKTEYFINKVMYIYKYKEENHITKYGFDKDGQ